MQIPLRAIGVFHAAARCGSISRAAEELGVTPSAVSQQIQTLEVQLGTALMVKAGRGVALTEAGERYFELIGDEIERISDATNHIRGFRAVTTRNIRATPTLATKWLLGRLPGFLDGNPGLEVHLDGTNEPTDFSKEGVDLEIRHGEGRWPGLFVEGLAEEWFLPVCAPGYCPAASLSAAELGRHRLIHSVKSQVQWGTWFQIAEAVPGETPRRVLFDRSHMSIDAAAGGMGIALESTLMMWRELREGALVCPVRDPPAICRTTQWLVCPREHLRHRKVQAFLAWLRAERDAWALEGHRHEI
ncbi:MAG: LysR family transcriptional regulator [Rhodospirillales bacterium]|nr:LysR family transcriptional regulator [Rhodospirillales bacterium]